VPAEVGAVMVEAGAAVLAAGGVASGAAAGAAVEAADGAGAALSSDLLQPASRAAATNARAVIEIIFMMLGSSFVMYADKSRILDVSLRRRTRLGCDDNYEAWMSSGAAQTRSQTFSE
jgi:hypothetical protein